MKMELLLFAAGLLIGAAGMYYVIFGTLSVNGYKVYKIYFWSTSEQKRRLERELFEQRMLRTLTKNKDRVKKIITPPESEYSIGVTKVGELELETTEGENLSPVLKSSEDSIWDLDDSEFEKEVKNRQNFANEIHKIITLG